MIELHECFTSNEMITYSALGPCKDEDLERLVFDDGNTYGGLGSAGCVHIFQRQ